MVKIYIIVDESQMIQNRDYVYTERFMSTVLMYRCNCGELYHAYIPNKAIAYYMDQSTEDIELAERIDEEIENDRKIKIARRVARSVKANYIDFTDAFEFHCKCGSTLDVELIPENFCRA